MALVVAFLKVAANVRRLAKQSPSTFKKNFVSLLTSAATKGLTSRSCAAEQIRRREDRQAASLLDSDRC
jgi:hypothetical protein